MKKVGNVQRGSRLVLAAQRYVTFFLLMSGVVTCCMLLFFSLMQTVGGLEMTEDMIQIAAKATFGNVVFISLLCTIIDGIRRKFMVDRPVQRIVHAAQQVMKGDLTARVPHRMDFQDGFDVIADYFNRMTEELSGMETLRTDFIANVSHELKTPLAVIQNYGTMLQQPNLSEEKRQEYAKAITEASRNLAGLITNILKLNKLENQQVYPNAGAYNLSEQLCECLLLFEDVWERKELEIETDIEENVTVNADEELLALVWNNLFSNAMKFTEPGGRISLSLQSQGEYAVVKVSDTGCGISQETGAHIFEKFYQGDTSHVMKGNGLGLALVKRIMDITGGDISVESQVGKGSTFTVKLRGKG